MSPLKKAVVTGGAGFIGSHLVDALVLDGYEVHVVDTYVGGRFADRVNTRATYHEVYIRSTDELQKIFQDAVLVFHTAAVPRVQYSVEHPVETTDVNVTGTVSVLTAAAHAKVKRVVYSASGSAYGEQTVMPLVENMKANPVNPYGLQKYVSEYFMSLWPNVYGVETVSLRYFNVYGPRIDASGPYGLAIANFLLAKKEGRPMTIFGDGSVTRDYTHVRDIVRANMLAAESKNVGKGEVINVGAGRNVTIQFLAELVGGEIIYDKPRIEAHDSRADNRKARELLRWEPEVSLEEGIAELKKIQGIS